MELAAQAHLQPLVDRGGTVRLVSKLQTLESALACDGLIRRQQQIELGSLRAYLAHGEDHVAADLVFQRHVPRLTVRYLEVWIHRVGVMPFTRLNVGKAGLQGQHLHRPGDKRRSPREGRLIDEVRDKPSIDRAVVKDAV